jgi:hypothetical protein
MVSNGTYASNVATRDNARTTNEGSTNVRDNRAVKVRHDHHVELAGLSHKLH